MIDKNDAWFWAITFLAKVAMLKDWAQRGLLKILTSSLALVQQEVNKFKEKYS